MRAPVHCPSTRLRMNYAYLGTLSGDLYGSRRGGRIEGIVLHKTGGARDTVQGIIEVTFPTRGVSANAVVGPDGTLYPVVADAYAAWHAGGTEEDPSRVTTSRGHSYSDIEVNRHFLGVEVVGESAEPYEPAQEDAMQAYVVRSINRYHFAPTDIVSHAQISDPDEGKIDGGEYLWQLRTYAYWCGCWVDSPEHGNPANIEYDYGNE